MSLFKDYLIAFGYVSFVLLLDVLLLTEMAVEQILLERPSTALLSQQSLGLTMVLFKLGGGQICSD